MSRPKLRMFFVCREKKTVRYKVLCNGLNYFALQLNINSNYLFPLSNDEQTLLIMKGQVSAQLISQSYNNSYNRVKITPRGGVTIFGVKITPKRSYFFL